MIGARVGVKVGARVGAAAGVSLDQIAVAAASAWSTDATSGKGVPANATEWEAALTSAGLSPATFAPSALWLLQEASGNAADSIGSFTLTASGTLGYQQAVAGWTRKAITSTDGVAGSLTSTSLSLPDILTTSHLVIAYVKTPAAAPGSARNLICLGATATRVDAALTPTTGRLRARSIANQADGTTALCDDTVHPIVIRVNRTSSEVDGASNADKVSPTLDVLSAGQGVRLGTGQLQASSSGYLYAVSFHGAAAQMTDAQIKTLLQTLGWTVGW